MLRSAATLHHHDLQARDGAFGRIHDIYFDDASWALRYLVVETGGWLTGRKVLISPASIASSPRETGRLQVNLTREQVANSPGIDTDKPVSRQQEESLHAHYGWPVYWGDGPFALGAHPTPLAAGTLARAGLPAGEEPLTSPTAPADAPAGDPHLRSMREVRGYRIEASDGGIGQVDDFIIDDNGWQVRFLVVDTRKWWPGRKVLVAPAWIARVSWNEQSVHVDLTRDAVRGSPEYDPATEVSREYVARLHEYYGRPHRGAW